MREGNGRGREGNRRASGLEGGREGGRRLKKRLVKRQLFDEADQKKINERAERKKGGLTMTMRFVAAYLLPFLSFFLTIPVPCLFMCGFIRLIVPIYNLHSLPNSRLSAQKRFLSCSPVPRHPHSTTLSP